MYITNKNCCQIKSIIKQDKNLCTIRYLNPKRQKGGEKSYFTKVAVVKFLDKYKN